VADCGAPMFPNAAGHAVRAEPPEEPRIVRPPRCTDAARPAAPVATPAGARTVVAAQLGLVGVLPGLLDDRPHFSISNFSRAASPSGVM